MGGWDPELRVNQDFEFDHRVQLAGYELLFDPDLVIGWESRQDIKALYKQYYRYGRGKVKVAAKHPDSVNPRHLVAPALVVWTGLAALQAARGKRRTAALMMAPYILGVGAATAFASRQLPEKSDSKFLPAAFVVMHYGWGFGFWRGVGDLVKSKIAPE